MCATEVQFKHFALLGVVLGGLKFVLSRNPPLGLSLRGNDENLWLLGNNLFILDFDTIGEVCKAGSTYFMGKCYALIKTSDNCLTETFRTGSAVTFMPLVNF